MQHRRCVRRITSLCILALLPSLPLYATAQVRLLSEHPNVRPAGLDQSWPSVMTHTHNWRFADGEKRENFTVAEKKLVAWCREMGIRAIGVGSAWNPENLANFDLYEGPQRNLYYSGKFDQRSVMDVAGVRQLLQFLNDQSSGATLFYLDNETPKSRMGHVWWFGYRYGYPAWHDNSQDRPIQYWEHDPEVEINPLSGEPQRRRNLFEVMAVEHNAGAIGIFAHPTRWWENGGKFVTNIAAMAGLFLLANGGVDGMAVMGDQVYNKSYQDLWFSFLDTGAKVPGFAETDFSLNKISEHGQIDTFRNYPHIGSRRLTEGTIRDAARAGDVFLSNGGFVNISVDGVPMGSVVRTTPGMRHRLRIQVYPANGAAMGRIEVIGKHGRELATKENFPGGILEYELPGSAEPDYVLVRAFGAGDDPIRDPDHVKYLAISNPVYLWPKGFEPRPALTVCQFRVAANSRWLGGSIAMETTDGQLIRKELIQAGAITATLPANGRVVLSKPGLQSHMFYIAMENPEVEKYLSYLEYGEFRKDYPNLRESVVPPQAFHLEALRKAVRHFDYQVQ